MNHPLYFPSCQRPYLWAVGPGADALDPGTCNPDALVHQRYRVVGPRLWLDTQPQTPPPLPDPLPEQALPYLKSHTHRLHLPGLYGVLPDPRRSVPPGTDPGATDPDTADGLATPVLLLDNIPVHPQTGVPSPALAEVWLTAPGVRQVGWLWQMWELWTPLQALGVAASLLQADNLRVEGGRLRLRQLVVDDAPPVLDDLAAAWQPLVAALPAASPLVSPLQQICTTLADAVPATSAALHRLLMEQASHLPIQIALAGATTAGPSQPHNEDACHPNGVVPVDPSGATPQLAIVCDGVGGHADGAVASQLAVQSLRLQLQALLLEAQQEQEPLPPSVVTQQLNAAVGVVNQLINHQNDSQDRLERRRMGTTLVMAVVLPQTIPPVPGTEGRPRRAQEVYIVHVGDSRAYWITPDYCQLLTVDDDIAGREVQAGRQTYALARTHPDAAALTQALGTRGEAYLQPHIQRLVMDEPGVLLLCSDGLSDHHRIEDAWANYIGLTVKDIVTLEAAVASWLELANQKNGHDNATVVLMQAKPLAAAPPPPPPQPEFATAATLYGEPSTEPEVLLEPEPAGGWPWWVLGLGTIALLTGLLGWWLVVRRPSVSPPPPTPELRSPTDDSPAVP